MRELSETKRFNNMKGFLDDINALRFRVPTLEKRVEASLKKHWPKFGKKFTWDETFFHCYPGDYEPDGRGSRLVTHKCPKPVRGGEGSDRQLTKDWAKRINFTLTPSIEDPLFIQGECSKDSTSPFGEYAVFDLDKGAFTPVFELANKHHGKVSLQYPDNNPDNYGYLVVRF